MNRKQNTHNNFLKTTREGGDNGLFIALVPKVFFFVGLTTLGTFVEFCQVIKSSDQMFQPLTVIYRGGNFVYHYWGCT